MRKVCRDWKLLLAMAFLALYLMAGTAVAAEPGAIMSGAADGERIVLYVQSPGEVQRISCQIGTVLCPEAAYGPISEEEIPVKTLLLLDNSLSIAQKYRPVINEIMNNLAANRMPGEVITVAVFSDKITYLLEDSSDYTQLKQTIDGITYEDQETYLTDALYELLKEWNQEADPVFRRIVMVSDGVDNKTMGYTKEELYSLLKEQPYPVYTLGCSDAGNGNGEALKNMSALSRLTQADAWLLDEVSDPMTVIQGVAQSNDLLRVEVTPPAQLCDGSAKGIKLNIEAGGESLESTLILNMPFATAAGEGAAQTEAAAAGTEADEEDEEDEAEQALLEAAQLEEAGILKRKRIFITAAVGGGTFLVAAALIIVIVRISRQKRKENEFEPAPEYAVHETDVPRGPVRRVMDDTELSGGAGGDETAMVWGDGNRACTLVVTDQDHPGKMFEVPLQGDVVVGRSRKDGCQIVLDYERSVSHCHCKITMENGQMKVTDLGSKNGTIVNGKKVIGAAAIPSGSILTLGNLRIKVELR